ncbi:MAG TPA: hypothetical protein VL197_04010 [Nitrospirota bacterium]|nr:hypothetical protein [Nitrospirota bacterium]
MALDFQSRYQKLRKKLEDDHYELQPSFDDLFKWVDDFMASEDASDLEKEFYLLLNQFPGDHQPYFVVPHERVLIENKFDYSPPPFLEYEIDFAVYGGTRHNPVKIALECDGLRSHRNRHSLKDRRKDVNLQLSGWLVIRHPGHEIHAEIEKWEKEETFISELAMSLDYVIKNALNLISHETYVINEVRSKLTGYSWGLVECSHCGFTQHDILNHKTILCRKCKKKYLRDRSKDTAGTSEYEGLILFP